MNFLKIYVFFIYLCVSIFVMTNAYFPYDKTSRKKVRRFSYCKGILYGVLAMVTVVDEFFLNASYSLVPYLTIYIAIMEAVQNVIQSKAEEFLEKANEKLHTCQKNKSFKKESEMLYIYCYQQISRLESGRNPDLERLIYEKVYDCLKYYTLADDFMSKFDDYRNEKCGYAELLKALDDWEEDFEMYGIEVVKNPEMCK